MPRVKIGDAVVILPRQSWYVVNQDMSGRFRDPALRFRRQAVYPIGRREFRLRPRIMIVPVTGAPIYEGILGGRKHGRNVSSAIGRAFKEFAAFCVAPKRSIG